MAVSSPYAVFTAAELGWPFAPGPGPSKRVTAPMPARAGALADAVLGASRERSGKQRRTAAIGAAMVQGELFQLA